MASASDKLADNAPGKWYVDSSCIDCDACRATAPANFNRSEENGYSFVCKQPENEEEELLCQDAMDACPVEAIGNDGA